MAYINNTGRLHDYLGRGKRGFCLKGNNDGRKTEYTLFSVIENKDNGVIIDTWIQMKAFEEALREGLIPWLKGCKIMKRNIQLGSSYIDYQLDCIEEKIYLEVKSAVLKQNSYAMYPDCPSLRGRRHIADLTKHIINGGKSVILFIAAVPAKCLDQINMWIQNCMSFY